LGTLAKMIYAEISQIKSICISLIDSGEFGLLKKFICIFDIWTISTLCREQKIRTHVVDSCMLKVIEECDMDFYQGRDFNGRNDVMIERKYLQTFNEYMMKRVNERGDIKIYAMVSPKKLTVEQTAYCIKKKQLDIQGNENACVVECSIDAATTEERVTFISEGKRLATYQINLSFKENPFSFYAKRLLDIRIDVKNVLTIVMVYGENEFVVLKEEEIDPYELCAGISMVGNRKYVSCMNKNNRIFYVALCDIPFEESVSEVRKRTSKFYEQGEKVKYKFASVSLATFIFLGCSVTQKQYEARLKAVDRMNGREPYSLYRKEFGEPLSDFSDRFNLSKAGVNPSSAMEGIFVYILDYAQQHPQQQ
jgi:hypothetical protein